MKVSELISELQDLMMETGDAEVFFIVAGERKSVVHTMPSYGESREPSVHIIDGEEMGRISSLMKLHEGCQP